MEMKIITKWSAYESRSCPRKHWSTYKVTGQEFGRAPSIGAEQPWHKAPLACHWYPAILLLHSIAFNVGWEPTLNLLSTQIMYQHVDMNFGF